VHRWTACEEKQFGERVSQMSALPPPLTEDGHTASSGFAVRVGYMAKALPYPVEVFLLPMQKDAPPVETPLSVGPKLHIVIPTDTDRHLKLGLFMSAWSLLEQTLVMFLRKLLGTDLKTAQVVMSTLGIRQVVDLLDGLGSMALSDTDLERLNRLTERLSSLNSQRNILVHGRWVLEANIYVKGGEAVLKSQFVRDTSPADPRIANRISDPKNQKLRMKHVFSLKRIDGVAQDVMHLTNDISTFMSGVTVLDRPTTMHQGEANYYPALSSSPRSTSSTSPLTTR
jgi:hypothetical protein